MSTLADGAKLDAVLAVAERLEQRASGSKRPEHVFCNAIDVANELRRILAFQSPEAHTPADRAMLELALWAQRNAGKVAADQLIGALLSEAATIHQEAGVSCLEHLKRCESVWDVVMIARDELAAANDEGEGRPG